MAALKLDSGALNPGVAKLPPLLPTPVNTPFLPPVPIEVKNPSSDESKKKRIRKKKAKEGQAKANPSESVVNDSFEGPESGILRTSSDPSAIESVNSATGDAPVLPKTKSAVPKAATAVSKKPVVKANVSSLNHWLNQVSTRICPTDESVIQFCKDENIPHLICPKSTRRSHPISHAARDEAVRRVLASHAKDTYLSVLDYYGSDRTLSFNPETSKFICDFYKDGEIVGKSNEYLKIDVTLGCHQRIGGDNARGGSQRRVVDVESSFDVVLLVDIYQGLGSASSPFDPDTAKMLLTHSKNGCIYWIGRTFEGAAGVDDCLEGAWYKNEVGEIVFSPEPNGQLYANHPSTDWLVERQFSGLDIAESFTIGPYKVFKISLSDFAGVPLNRTVHPSGFIDYRVVSVQKDLNQIESFLYGELIGSLPFVPRHLLDKLLITNQSVPVHLATAAAVRAYIYRSPSGSAVDACNSLIANSFNNDRKMKEFGKRFPEQFNKILTGTLFSALYGNRDVVAQQLLNLRKAGSHSESILKQARSPELENTQRKSNYFITIAKYVGGATLILKALKIIKSLIQISIRYYKFSRHQLNSGVLKFLLSMWKIVEKQIIHLSSVPPEMVLTEFLAMFRRFDTGIFALNSGFVKKVIVIIKNVFSEMVKQFKLLRRLTPLMLAEILFEEVVKMVCPIAGPGLGLLEFYRLGATPNLVFHSLTGLNWFLWRKMSVSFKLMVFVYNLSFHAGYNARVVDLWSKGIEFRKAHDEGFYIEATSSMLLPLDLNTPFKATTVLLDKIPNKTRGSARFYYDKVEVSLAEAIELVKTEVKDDSGFYVLLSNSSVLYRPSNSDANLLAALELRRLRDPELPSEEFLKEAYKNAVLIAKQIYTEIPHGHPTFIESIENMKDGGKRLLRSHEANERGEFIKPSVTSFMKRDELLPLKDVGTAFTQIKTRIIMNYEPVIHAQQSQVWKKINDCMHANLNGQIKTIGPVGNTVTVQIYFASGFTQAQLSEIGETLRESPHIVIVAAGDDSLVKFPDPTRFNFLHFYEENDQSTFDITQGDVCLETAHKCFSASMDIPLEDMQLAADARKAPFTSGRGRLRISAKTPAMLSTGEKGTTVINTHDTVQAYTIHIFNVLQAELNGLKYELTLRQTCTTLGYKTTGFSSNNLHDLTFLKGWWLSDSCGNLMWYPLPSQVIKAGKTLKHPTVIAHTGDISKAIYQCVNAVAKGYGNVDHSYPIFGAFLKTCSRIAGSVATEELKLEKELIDSKRFRVLVEGKVDRLQAIDMIFQRYGITFEDIARVEKLYENVNFLPTVVVDPVFNKLVNKDYPGDPSPMNTYHI
jgi:hypothetical protein